MIAQLWRGVRLVGNDLTYDEVSVRRFFRNTGILSRMVAGGNPAYVDALGIQRTIEAHVAPRTIAEHHLRDHSSYVSFTSSRDRAEFYARSGRDVRLVPCADLREEQAVIFRFDVSSKKLTGPPGVWVLHYQCDETIIEASSPEELDPLVGPSPWTCDFCNGEPKDHELLLMDVFKYLKSFPAHATRPEAVELAEQDSEWLLLPTDYIRRLKGRSGQIPPSTTWDYEAFKFE